jgi:hypothetical protein
LDPRSTEFYSAQRAVVAAALPIQVATQQPQELRDGATAPFGHAWPWLVALCKRAAFCGRRVANSTYCIVVVASSASGFVV